MEALDIICARRNIWQIFHASQVSRDIFFVSESFSQGHADFSSFYSLSSEK